MPRFSYTGRMSKVFSPRRLDVKSFAEEGGVLSGEEWVRDHARLVAETEGRPVASPVTWSAVGEMRNPSHVHPEIWLHLKANALLPLTCQRCLGPVDVPVEVDRTFRFAPDEEIAQAVGGGAHLRVSRRSAGGT